LAEEYKERGISFNVLALGAVQTEMLEEAFPGYQAPIKANEMADYIFDFTLTGNKYYNGKVLQVSSTNRSFDKNHNYFYLSYLIYLYNNSTRD
jgi:NAD(P)-dependent dehydrogenase (short-subunit alcohol dehydrogenase family)